MRPLPRSSCLTANGCILQVYIVTGGTAGIGFGITAHLLQHNASKIIIVSQNEEYAEEAKEELKKYGDASKVHWVQCDLKDLKKTEEVAQQLKSEKQLDAVSHSHPKSA